MRGHALDLLGHVEDAGNMRAKCRLHNYGCNRQYDCQELNIYVARRVMTMIMIQIVKIKRRFSNFLAIYDGLTFIVCV